jgi:hypothetical protein
VPGTSKVPGTLNELTHFLCGEMRDTIWRCGERGDILDNEFQDTSYSAEVVDVFGRDTRIAAEVAI